MKARFIELDLRGLKCPLPALRASRRLRELAPGQRLVVHSDDPLARLDIPHACAEQGHRLLEMDQHGGAWRFEIERGASAE